MAGLLYFTLITYRNAAREKDKTACWTNTVVKFNYACWAFFIGIILAGAETKLCVCHVTEQQTHSFQTHMEQ